MPVALRMLAGLAENLLLKLKAIWGSLSTLKKSFITVVVLAFALRRLRQLVYRIRIRRALNDPNHSSYDFKIAIVGAGFSGLLMGIKLKQQGIHNFTIYDKASGVGGTWFHNRYPGVACDVPSSLYCYSFEQDYPWSCDTPPGSEIRGYLEFVTDKYGLRDHLALCHSVDSAVYDHENGLYTVTIRSYHPETGELTSEFEELCNALVIGTGQLNIPKIPSFQGLSDFDGPVIHTAQWPDDFDPRGKRIGIIGTGPSGFQCAPALAKVASKLVVFQRSISHVTPFLREPKVQRSDWEKRVRYWFPIKSRMERWFNFLSGDLLFLPMLRTWHWDKNHWFRRFVQNSQNTAKVELIDNIGKGMDQESRAKMEDAWNRSIPSFPLGCKRLLLGKEWFPMFAQSHVNLETRKIECMSRNGIIVRDSEEKREQIDLDAIVMATGFHSQSFVSTIEIKGKSGQSLKDAWMDGYKPYNYKGICVSDYPNMFLLYGPFTNLATNSIIFMLECQSTFIIKAIREMIVRRKQSLEVKYSVMKKFQDKVNEQLKQSVWSSPQCKQTGNWYTNHDGICVNNWAFTCIYYWYLTRNINFDNFNCVSSKS